MNALKKAYRWFADHATKALGALGLGLMSLDPDAIHSAALAYLDDHTVRSIGKGLFALVILRGWYTGWKHKQDAQTLPPPEPQATR